MPNDCEFKRNLLCINNGGNAGQWKQNSSGEEDEDPDDIDNQEDGSLGRHGGQTTRNGLTSATLSVRVTSR